MAHLICLSEKSIGKNYAIVHSPEVFELAPLLQYLANSGIHGDYSFLCLELWLWYVLFGHIHLFILGGYI